jgi:hypothetical protein
VGLLNMLDYYGVAFQYKDIVSICGRYGWVWFDEDEAMVAWDLSGPSLEDSEPIINYMNDPHCLVKIIGKMNS